MFKIGIVDNIKLSLDLVINSFENIYENNEDAKSYKLAIINLHNAFELTFKFMILNRNEFMLFLHSNNGFTSALEKYKTARKNNYYSLLDYFESNPAEKQLHTISFNTAYKVLAYMYHINEFDEHFLFQLDVLENLRNKLTHFEATINKIDLILIISLFEKCVEILNKEIEEKFSSPMNFMKFHKYDKYNYSFKAHTMFYELSKRTARDNILNERKYRLILGVVVYGHGMMELNPEKYDVFAKICYEARKNEFNEAYCLKNENEIISLIAQDIYILLSAYLIHSEPVYYQEVDVLSKTVITEFAIELIREKWVDISIICSRLEIKEIPKEAMDKIKNGTISEAIIELENKIMDEKEDKVITKKRVKELHKLEHAKSTHSIFYKTYYDKLDDIDI